MTQFPHPFLASFLSGEAPEPPRGIPFVDDGWLPFCRLPVKSGQVWVGDPLFCWAELESETGFVAEVQPGEYEVWVHVLHVGKSAYVRALALTVPGTPLTTHGETIGEAGTDSAQIGVVDAVDFLQGLARTFSDEEQYLEFLSQADPGRCGVVQLPHAPELQMAVVMSGFGDGVGPVYEHTSKGERIGLECEFIPPELHEL